MQNGSVIRAERQRGPDVWEFRWREPGADGKRKHRRMILYLLEAKVPLAGAGRRTAKLVKGARLHVVNGGPHCVIWTHAEEVNAELSSFLGEEAVKAKRGGA
jgi:pimeloyl-ACP methyl ester carboxylesterase